MPSGVGRCVTLQKKRGTVNVERLTTLRDARTAWVKKTGWQNLSPFTFHLSPFTFLLSPFTFHLTNLKIYAKQVAYLEASPANHHHRAYGNRHNFWGAVVPLS